MTMRTKLVVIKNIDGATDKMVSKTRSCTPRAVPLVVPSPRVRLRPGAAWATPELATLSISRETNMLVNFVALCTFFIVCGLSLPGNSFALKSLRSLKG